MLIKDITMTTVGVILFRILDEWIIYLQMLFQMKVSYQKIVFNSIYVMQWNVRLQNDVSSHDSAIGLCTMWRHYTFRPTYMTSQFALTNP